MDADGKARKGGALAKTTLHRCHTYVKAVLNGAVEDRDIALCLNAARPKKARPENGEREEIHPLSENGLAAVLSATVRDVHALFAVLANTGMRHGEAQALRWDDIDLEKRRATIDGSLHRETGRGEVEGPTKTKTARIVPLRPETVRLLQAHKAMQAEMRLKAGTAWQERGYVFTDEVGRPLNQKRIERAFHRACKRAGIERHMVKDLRHTFATLALQRGVPVKVVSAILGHSKTGITQDIYMKYIPGEHDDAFTYLDRVLS